jgi:hypothetical protein
MGTQVDELARCLVFGALLEEVTRRFGGYELVAHWTQGEFHHDVVLRLPEAATPMGARVLVVATNCNGGIKEVLGFNEIPDRAALWHHRCPTVPEFDGDLAPIVARAVTEHWFDPCELLVQMRGASCEPSTGGVNLVAAGNTPRESRDQAAGDRGMITSPRRRAA